MSFKAIRDQEVPVRLLRRVLRRDRVPNALLFWGPAGVGKRMTALELAKAVNCRAPRDGDPCDACLSCRKVVSGNHPDVRVVVPVKRSRNIDVDTVEGVNEMAALRPYEGGWRVFVILDADRMNIHAQNHFLKTLEEPPGRAAFVLVSESPRLLLPTIRSRCQMVRFRPLSPLTVVEILQAQRDLPLELAQAIAALSQGQMSRALDLVDSEKREIVLDLIARLAEAASPVDLAEEFTKNLAAQRKQVEAQVEADLRGEHREALTPEDRERLVNEQMAQVDALCRRDLLEYLYLLETWYRDELVFNATGDAERILNRDQLARFSRVQAVPGADSGRKILAVERARRYLDRYVNEERVFRDLFFALAG